MASEENKEDLKVKIEKPATAQLAGRDLATVRTYFGRDWEVGEKVTYYRSDKGTSSEYVEHDAVIKGWPKKIPDDEAAAKVNIEYDPGDGTTPGGPNRTSSSSPYERHKHGEAQNQASLEAGNSNSSGAAERLKADDPVAEGARQTSPGTGGILPTAAERLSGSMQTTPQPRHKHRRRAPRQGPGIAACRDAESANRHAAREGN